MLDSRDPPPWILAIAEDLYDRMERIDGEAMNDAQVAQDERAGRITWTHRVAEIIADHVRRVSESRGPAR